MDEIMVGDVIRDSAQYSSKNAIIFNSKGGFINGNGPFSSITEVIPMDLRFRSFVVGVLNHDIDVDKLDCFKQFMANSDAAKHGDKATRTVSRYTHGPGHSTKSDDEDEEKVVGGKKPKTDDDGKRVEARSRLVKLYKSDKAPVESKVAIAKCLMGKEVMRFPSLVNKSFDQRWDEMKDDSGFKEIMAIVPDDSGDDHTEAKGKTKSTDETPLKTTGSFDSVNAMESSTSNRFGTSKTFSQTPIMTPLSDVKKSAPSTLEDLISFNPDKCRDTKLCPKSASKVNQETDDEEEEEDGTPKPSLSPKRANPQNEQHPTKKKAKTNKTESKEDVNASLEVLITDDIEILNQPTENVAKAILKQLKKENWGHGHHKHAKFIIRKKKEELKKTLNANETS